MNQSNKRWLSWFNNRLPKVFKPITLSKHAVRNMPHDGPRAKARRRRQIERGILKVG